MFTNTDIEIPPDNPFANDKLGRKPIAANLTKLVGTFTGPTVLGINASWGMGKTTFLHMWKGMLENQGFHCIYFNAWENDFAREPLIPFVYEFVKSLESTEKRKTKGYKSKGKGLLHAAGRFTQAFGTNALKGLTNGMLDIENTHMQSAYGHNTSEIVGETSKSRIQEFEEQRKAIQNFKDRLDLFIGRMNRDNDDKPVLFMVDELDRCRPTFSIELLETVKHLFSVPGLVFVLAMDVEQLAHSVKVIYGSDFEATGYLRRFIDFEISLPYPEDSRKFIEYWFDRAGFNSSNRTSAISYNVEFYILWFELYSFIFECSARDQVHLFRQLSVVRHILSPNYIALAIFVCIIKLKRPDLFNIIEQEQLTADEILSSIEKDIPQNISLAIKNAFNLHWRQVLDRTWVWIVRAHINTHHELNELEERLNEKLYKLNPREHYYFEYSEDEQRRISLYFDLKKNDPGFGISPYKECVEALKFTSGFKA